MKWVLLLLLTFVLGCQQKPTVGVTDSGVLVQNKDYRKVVLENSIVFDTRSPFEFNTGKVPGSINLPLQDFSVNRDPMDAARRLSLYGVNPQTSVVILGHGQGDEQKLAWEFIKLGVTKVETLKVEVFSFMNLKPEPAKKNVPLWKPENRYGELKPVEFDKKMESVRPKPNLGARAETYQGFPVSNALRRKVLVVTLEKDWTDNNKYPFADHLYITDRNLFDNKGLLNRAYLQEQKIENDFGRYDIVFLVDSTMQRYSHAYALVQFGAKSLFLVH